MSEHEIQCLLIKWASAIPELKCFAIPNGEKRNIMTGAKLKKAGVKAGVPDLFFCVPRGGYHGLFIELKSEKGRLSNEQKYWLEVLANNGYRSAVCFGLDEAKNTIIDYLNLCDIH